MHRWRGDHHVPASNGILSAASCGLTDCLQRPQHAHRTAGWPVGRHSDSHGPAVHMDAHVGQHTHTWRFDPAGPFTATLSGNETTRKGRGFSAKEDGTLTVES